MIGEGRFVEHAKFGGNRYGTSKKTIEELTKTGKCVLLDIEMEVCITFTINSSLMRMTYLRR